MNDPVSDKLEIVYQDDVLIAINKPSGLLVHRSPIDKRETRFALQMLRDQIGQRVYTVHRLDKPTSGLLLFTLDPDAQKTVGLAFDANLVKKRYVALVRGFTENNNCIDYPLPIMADFKHQTVKETLQPAVTNYETLDRIEIPVPCGRYAQSRYSLLDLTPSTGRKHQLRRHLKHIFHPIVGDTTHGDGKHNTLFRTHYHCHRLMLAATELELPHPTTGETLRIACEPDESFNRVITELWSTAK